MSLVKIQGNPSGTGAFTIAAPNGNTDRTLTLPDATGTVNVSGLANEVPAGSAGTPAIYPTGDSNTGIFFPAADTVGFSAGGTERVRIDANGIKFNGDTAAANALDDYEEGTWTPTTGGSGVPVSGSTGYYTKVGQVVHIEGFITFGSTSNTSQCNIDGFPFAGAANTRGGFFVRYTNEGGFPFTMHMNGSSQSCALYFTSGGSADYSSFSGNRIDFVGSYRV